MENEELIKNVLGNDAHIVKQILGGMMNESYLVQARKKHYIWYIPTVHANEMVNRYLERDNQRIIYKLGITSRNVYFDPDSGVKINEFIEGFSLDKLDPKEIDLNRVAGIIKYIHNNPIKCQEDYLPFRRLLSYEKEVNEFVKRRSNDYIKMRELLFENREYLESQPLCLCHNDAQRSNIIKEEKTGWYYIIDFEFVANNDPIYDIAAYGNNDVQEGRDLLSAYFGGQETEDEIRRYYLWRLFLSLQWHNVALIKDYRGEGRAMKFDFIKVADDFLKNAKEAYEHLKK